MSDTVHLYVGRSEEEYKEANESFRLNRVFPLLVSPLCITGLIGDQELGSPGRVLSKFGFLSNIVYKHPQPVPLTISLKVSLPIHCMRVVNEVVVSSFDTERSSIEEGFVSDRELWLFLISSFSVTFSVHLASRTKVTWLILPVVICLSQRLSHACLSINIFIQ